MFCTLVCLSQNTNILSGSAHLFFMHWLQEQIKKFCRSLVLLFIVQFNFSFYYWVVSMANFFILTQGQFFIVFRERQWKRERERETSIGCLLLRANWGLNPQPGHVPWPGIKPKTFQSRKQHSHQLSHTSQEGMVN